MIHTVSAEINGHPLSLETGKVAKQADGAVVVRHGGTVVLATCVAANIAASRSWHEPQPVPAAHSSPSSATVRAPAWMHSCTSDSGTAAHRQAYTVAGLLRSGW